MPPFTVATSHEQQPSLAVIPATKSRGFLARSYREPSFRYLWHSHPEWELTWTRSGRGLRHIGRSIEQFDDGDLVLLAGNIPHSWHSTSEQIGEAQCSVLHFLPNLWGEDFWRLPEVRPLRTLCDKAVRGLKFHGPDVYEVGRRIEALAAEGASDFTAFARVIEIFELLLQLPHESLNAASMPNVAKPNPRLQELLEWIENNISQPLPQSEVAKRVNMTPAVFSRWFKASVGCVFQRYLIEMRVARVCAVLAQGDASIIEAALSCGFNNLSNFNRRFVAVTGLTPTAYRRQLHGRSESAGG